MYYLLSIVYGEFILFLYLMYEFTLYILIYILLQYDCVYKSLKSLQNKQKILSNLKTMT